MHAHTRMHTHHAHTRMHTHACTHMHARTHTHTHTALRQLMEAVTEAKKLEAENAHQWKQTKHLLKYIKNQEKEMGRNERCSTGSTVFFSLIPRPHPARGEPGNEAIILWRW